MMTIQEEIKALKEKHNALILGHFYQEGEIQEIADYVGDSLSLAQKGQEADNPVVLMAGVVFMGESVKLLSPEKTVLVPDLNAGCSLVDHSPYEKFKKWRESYPDAICVTYVNSSADVKSLSDVICTSSNAEKIINAIPKDKQILFAPDANLGGWLSRKLNREMILYPGSCQVHVLFSEKKLHQLKLEHPDAKVIAHPECMEEILQYADAIGSTSFLLKQVEDNPSQKFIVATEIGIFHEMQKRNPTATLIQAPAEGSCACNECPYMKLNSLEKIKQALETLSPAVEIDKDLMERARLPLDRMMDISAGKPVNW